MLILILHDNGNSMPDLPLTQLAHAILESVITAGDTVIDATVGNGHDTLFLAHNVGPNGKVYGFDIQQAALDTCYQRLCDNAATKQVSLFHAGHETMPMFIPENLQLEQIKAIMFNLGYLPGGDKQRCTQFSTTLNALSFSLQAISIDGVISILAYTGHSGGKEECDSIKNWLGTLDKNAIQITIHKPENTIHSPPELIIIRKSKHQ